ncbi:hypothetical protein V1478_010322 [Vespula squamosa]|uniref:Uncharacterized protein n=1 Tax=Vespula squamosa TaxID=30214 RepID=A0ABD2AHF6_VESSQ
MVRIAAWKAEDLGSRPGLVDYLTAQLFSCILWFGIRSEIEEFIRIHEDDGSNANDSAEN